MDDVLRITLPSFIGILISTPIMLMIDLSKQDQITMFFILLPMMVGAMISMVIAFRSISPKKGNIKNE